MYSFLKFVYVKFLKKILTNRLSILKKKCIKNRLFLTQFSTDFKSLFQIIRKLQNPLLFFSFL